MNISQPMPGQSKDQAPSDNAIKAPAITLPKGGGAIRGIGEKFAANPVTGTGSMSVPIATSPGRAGFGPQLSLSYDSGAGNGAFGLGWNLSLPSITRKTDKGLPKYHDADESDVFILSGAEDLVPVGPATNDPSNIFSVQRYRPRIEGLFARIEHWTKRSSGTSYWRSISKDNITTIYGRTAESQIVDPAEETRIFSWLICESYDDKGNAIRYQYKGENAERVDLSAANERNRSRAAPRYLKRIKYGNKTPHQRTNELSKHPDEDWMFEVVFDYGEHYIESSVTGDDQSQPTTVRIDDSQQQWAIRQDPFSSYRSGFEVRTYRLCQRVLMFHHFPDELEIDNYLVRATHLRYRADPSASFISAVTQSGYLWQAATNDYLKKSLPPVEFEYSAATINETVRDVDADSLENLPYGLDGTNYQWVDLDGEGLSGILTEQGGAWFYKRNLGAVPISPPNETPPRYAARFAPIERLPTMPSSANLKGGQQLLDLAGDGQLDVVEFDGPAPGFFERTPEQGWKTFAPFTSLPNLAWKDPNLKFVDLTGDGHADILVTENEVFTWYSSLAEEGFGPAEKVHQPFDEEAGPRLVFADGTQSIYLSDLSGDGLTDLVRIRNGAVCYWPNLGYGRFGKKVTMDNAPWFDAPDQFDQKRIRLTDIYGSGTVDILYLGRDGVHLYFNNAGNSWAPVRKLNTFPRTDNLSSVMATDLFGNGTACLVWSSPLPGDARRPMRYIDLMGGQKPHLLVKTTNNLGAETRVDYAPSTKFYLADKLAGRPWITKLPFPVHCVERVTVIDRWRNTRFASTYSYHHGYFDGIEREFRGFGRVEQVDVESYGKFQQGNVASPYITDDRNLYQPPIKTITWYHTGFALERDRILAAYEQEYFPLSNFTEHKLPQPTLTPDDLSAEEWREAARACKGMVLRQEVFELDVDALEQGQQLRVRLFTTAFHNSTIQRLQPRGRNRHAVFLVTESEAITYHYELDLKQGTPDPRIAHTLNLRFDSYGRALQSVAVTYPRQVAFTDPANTLKPEQLTLIQEVQRERHLAYTETHYTAELLADPDQHRLPAPCEALTYELTGAQPTNGFTPSSGLYFSLDDFSAFALSDSLPGQGSKAVTHRDYHQQPLDDTAHKRIVEWVRILYFKDNLSDPEPFGNHAWIGLPYETYKLALTNNLLNAIFADSSGNKLDQPVTGTTIPRQLLNNPGVSGYLSGALLVARFAPIPAATLAGQYWIRSGIAGFAADAADHFYLPEEYTDPFDNKTKLAYDGKYDLFIQSSTDMLGNTIAVIDFNYRVLAPSTLKDINDNETETYFDILGMVVAVAAKGKGSEGDNLVGYTDALANPPATAVVSFCTSATLDETQASTWLANASARFVYHFGERIEANGTIVWNDRMAGACGIVRERHASQVALDPAHENPLQVSLECSDGSGNVLMKKAQAEPDPVTGQARWIVNGLTVLNNKGKPVKQYEPSFVPVFGCSPPTAEGVTPVMYYDAAGRVVRTEMPDGAFNKVEFSPWHMKAFDANDTVKDSRWYFERLTATERGVPLHGQNDTPQQRVEALAAEALAQTASAENKRAARLAAQHADTPSETHLDSLGREVIAIAHNRSHGIDEKYLTFTKLDAEGKPLWICDARGNLVMQYITPPKPNHTPLYDQPNPDWRPAYDMPSSAVPCYDIAGNLLFQHSMDAGDRWMLMDAAGKPMLAWDMNETPQGTTATREDRFYTTDYDKLHRPTAQWLTINTAAPVMVEKYEYQDAVANDANNLNGQLIKHYDASGRVETMRRDFSGNVREVQRRLNNQPRESLIDWSTTNPDSLLETETFIQITEYDALKRMTRLYNWHRDLTFAPDGAQQATPGETNRVAVYVPAYNQRGALASEWLHVRASKATDANGQVSFTADAQRSQQAIQEIRYNAKGQKELLKLGNGTITNYAYDLKTFRLTTIETRRPIPAGDQCSSAFLNAAIIQDLGYTYDPVGNITQLVDAAQAVVHHGNQRIDPINRYEYDALYRLIQASGKENGAATVAPTHIEGGSSSASCPAPDPAALRNYTQTYRYDPVGNIEQMRHVSDGGNWTRNYTYAFEDSAQLASNRLWRTWQGDIDWDGNTAIDKVTYGYDTHGNILNLANVSPRQFLRWDHHDMIARLDLIGGGEAFYQYDAGKQRTRKRIENQNGHGGFWERIYLGGYELYRRYTAANSTVPVEEIESLHLLEGEQRVLLVDDVIIAHGAVNPRPDGLAVKAQTLFRYQYSNHLGSACLELDHRADVISYEEYHPYGTSAYRAMKSGTEAPPQRYRYTGMERDEESGFNYHGARYYAVFLGRWLTTDPIQHDLPLSQYCYVPTNVVKSTDRDGKAPPPAEAQTFIGQGSALLSGPDTHLDRKTALAAFAEAQAGGVYDEFRGRLRQHHVEILNDASRAEAFIANVNRYIGTAEGLSAEASAQLLNLSARLQTSVNTARQQTLPTYDLLADQYGARLSGTAFRTGELIANELQDLAQRTGTPTLLPEHAAFKGVMNEVNKLPERGAVSRPLFSLPHPDALMQMAKDAKKSVGVVANDIKSASESVLKFGKTWGPRAASALGIATVVYGAWNQSDKAYKQATPNIFNKEAAGIFTFGAAIVGGVVDDVAIGRDIALTGGGGYTQVAMHTFEREGGSPLQVSAKDFFVWFSQF